MTKRPRLIIALIEIGTNSIKLLIAGFTTAPEYEIEHLSRITTRLGEGLERNNRIDPMNLTKTLETIDAFQKVIANYNCNKTFVFSTHVLREAANAPAVLQAIESKTGHRVEVLSGQSEAQFAYISAKNRLQLDRPHTVLMDIGGGSTEFVHAHNGKIKGVLSLPLGALYLTSHYLKSDPIKKDEYNALEAHIDRTIMEAGRVILHPDLDPLDIELVASGGAVSTLGRMIAAATNSDYDPASQPQIHQPAVADLLKQCLSCPLHTRKALPGLEPDRADIIVAGLAVILQTMKKMNKPVLCVNEAGVREGVLQAVMKNGLQWPRETISRGAV
jgi:exopolyphosphatase/guanosine-5'-triphosphate,3'-diphosphate pyrophosphatase